MNPRLAAVVPQVFLAALLFAMTAASPYFSRFMNANERPRLLQGVAWVESGSSAIDGPATRHIPAGIDVSRTPDGALVPNKPPGTTVPAALAYGLVRGPEATLATYTQVARGLGGWLPMLLLVGLAWHRRHTPANAFALVALALATPCLAYGRLLYGHVLAAALLWGGLRVLVRADRQGSPGWAALGGAIAAGAVAVEYLAAFAGLPIAAWLVHRAWSRRAPSVTVAAAMGACVPIVLLMVYQNALFGSPWATPYHFVVREGFAEIHGRGLLGLTVPTTTSVFEHLLSPWGGLLYWAPLVVPAVWASVLAVRREQADTFERLGLAVFGLLFVLNLCLAQTGGWRVGPRYLVLALPCLLPGLRRVHGWLQRPGLGAVVVALFGWSLLVNFLAAGLFPHLLPEGNPLWDLLLPLWAEGVRPHALWGAWGMGVGGVVSLVLFVATTRPSTAQARRAWLLGVVGAVLLVVASARVPSSRAAEDTLASLLRIWEPGGSTAPARVRFSPAE